MEEHHTKRSTRIIMWVIALVMAGGFIGSYFLIIMGNSNQAKSTAQSQSNTPKLPIDPTAYKVADKVTQLQTTDLTVGTGATAGADDLLRIHYKGTIAKTGEKFDSSYDRGEPLTCKLTNLIKGWQQGIPGMKVGGKRRLVIPSDLAYGAQGNATIPANSDLVFEVELLAVNPAGATDECAQ